MTDLPGGDNAARAIHRAMGKLVRYTGAGVVSKSIYAVRTHGAAGSLYADESARSLSFELRKEDLAGIPKRGDILIEGNGTGTIWTVDEFVDLDDVDAFRVTVKAAA
jgi:hypothetical protein